MRALPLVATLVSACAGPGLPSPGPGPGPTPPPARAEVPFTRLGKSPVVEVTIDGQGPFRFLFDTGAFRTVVTPELASHLGARPIGQEQVLDPSGTRQLKTRVLLARLAIGSAMATDVEALVVDLGPIGKVSGEPIQGIVGLPPFDDRLVTIDYPGRRLVIEDGALGRADGREILRTIRFRDQLPALPLAVGLGPLAVVIDTGSDRGLDLPTELERELDWAVPPRALAGRSFTVHGLKGASAWRGRLRLPLRIGHHVVEYPVTDLDQGTLPTLGGAILEHFVITFDGRNRRVRFHRPDGAGPLRMIGLARPATEIGYRPDGALIVGPEPAASADGRPADGGSPAADRLRPGEVIVAVDGQAIANVTPEALRQTIEDGNGLDVTVVRDGQPVVHHIAVRDLIPPPTTP